MSSSTPIPLSTRTIDTGPAQRRTSSKQLPDPVATLAPIGGPRVEWHRDPNGLARVEIRQWP